MTSLNDLLKSTLSANTYVDRPTQGVHPQFASLFSTTALDFDFNQFLYPHGVSGWKVRKFKYKGYEFSLYLPEVWSIVEETTSFLSTYEGKKHRQTFSLLPRDGGYGFLHDFVLSQRQVLGFFLSPLLIPQYHRWIFVTDGDKKDTYDVWGAYMGGAWFVMVEGMSPDQITLKKQLLSLMNSNPWQVAQTNQSSTDRSPKWWEVWKQ